LFLPIFEYEGSKLHLVVYNYWSFLQNFRQATKVQQRVRRKRKQNYNVPYAAWKGSSACRLKRPITVIIHHLTILKMLRFVKLSYQHPIYILGLNFV